MTPTRLEGQERPSAAATQEAFAYCRRLAGSHYENFTVGSWLLPRGALQHMHNIYAYCRTVDDLGDEAAGDRLALLAQREEDLRRCYTGTPQHPVLLALQQTISQYDIPVEPFLKLIEANRIDQRTVRHPTCDDLLHYCDHSANPVGHLVLYIFGYRDRERQALADCTCTALQLTNFWQDIATDIKKGRVYIPLEDMEFFGYSQEELRLGVVNRSFVALLRFQIARTRDLFRRGLELVPMVDGRLRLDLKLFTMGGLRVLDAIERIDYDIFRRRPALARWEKGWLMVRGLIPVLPKVRRGA
ncbi:MAG: squalene synthase HpnC [Dehalococcoidia bacterium]